MFQHRRSHPPGAPDVPGYELLTPVGFGAAGAVWSARDPGGHGVVVAVVPLAPGPRGAAQLRRLGRLRGSHHPHLAQVLDVVALAESRCAVVSEVVAGPSLATVRTARGGLTAPEIATLLAGLGGALGYLHARGVVHADVSPTNVLLAPGGVPVLVDLVGEGVRERGTSGFVAPERADGAAPGAPGDVWALARLLLWASDGDAAVDRLVGPALSANPGTRPAARDLATLAPSLAHASGVVLPDPGALAQAQLRADAVHVPTQLAQTRRVRRVHRRGSPVRRVAVLIGLAVLGVGGVGWTAGGELPAPGTKVVDAGPAVATEHDPGGGAGGNVSVGQAEVLVAVRELLTARDDALRTGDAALLTSLSVPGSAPAEADALLLDRLLAAGAVVEGLRTELSRLRVVAAAPGRGSHGEGAQGAAGGAPVGSGPAGGRTEVGGGGSGGAVVVKAWTRQGAYSVVTEGASPTEVPAQPERCTRLTLERPPWRVADVAPC
ncbi:MAG: protein kinase domain-containing protein [Georgenia sp.]